ncbi:DUF1566 domain-containing protein [Legionella cardiaca]|uniref:DUF1566 domain-containing protein n=1 Tax=Legionella cardiaca TaxID=1071983 RepID=A0ABY8AYV5_9GAMM|nr:DUF1566 domain-containing protein [Legionella cardiaca]WED44287.1 DUF1566 domain-containing protein [Legionella cardiaca]
MNRISKLIYTLLIGAINFLFIPTVQAFHPVWTFEPLTETEFSIPATGSAIVQYTVTNHSSHFHTLYLARVAGINQVTTVGNCQSPLRLAHDESCTLTLQINARNLQGNIVGGPELCEQANPNLCYRPASENILKITVLPVPGNTTLTSSVTTLALQAGGVARVITVTNRGVDAAFNVTYTPSPALPSGTRILPASCGTILPGGRCVLVIIPGVNPSAAPGNVNPLPITLTIKGNNTNLLTPSINILTYGSVYQSGFLFDINDSTPNSGSIGGKVAALSDRSSPAIGVIWSSDGSGSTSPFAVSDNIPGIYENSIAPPCTGNSDGSCNTGVIVAYYSPPVTNPAVNLAFYAAGLCRSSTDGGYSNWYLPSICEMGYDTASAGSGCSSGIPVANNIESNLVNNNIGGFLGPYWSSTESTTIPLGDAAWVQLYNPGVGNLQGSDDKYEQRGVRCVRVVTP